MKRVDTTLPIEQWGLQGTAVIYLPDDYAASISNYPVIMFLHGVGEAADQGGLPALFRWGLPKQMEAGLQLPAIVVCPQSKTYSHQFNAVRWMIFELIKRYRVDQGSIHLTGISAGGGGIWSSVTNIGTPPIVQLISTICPVSSMAVLQTYEGPTVKDVAAKGVAVWCVCGTGDSHYGVQVDYVNMIKANNPLNLPVGITGVPGDHSNTAWEPAYDPNEKKFDGKNMYDFMFANARSKRGAQPAPVPDPPPIPVRKLIST